MEKSCLFWKMGRSWCRKFEGSGVQNALPLLFGCALYHLWRAFPNNPIIKSNWKGRKARSFGILSRLRAFLLPFLRTHNIVENMLRTLTIPLPIFSKGIFSSCWQKFGEGRTWKTSFLLLFSKSLQMKKDAQIPALCILFCLILDKLFFRICRPLLSDLSCWSAVFRLYLRILRLVAFLYHEIQCSGWL